MSKIYCFINGGYPDMLNVIAVAEDGKVLAGHCSSHRQWAIHDIGITSDWKHEHYKEHYPDGYELVWLDDPANDEDFKKIIELNKARIAAENADKA